MTPVSQSEFRTAVFDPAADRPAGLSNGQAAPAGKRFDVYRNNVIVSLKEAMATGFPVIHKLIGAENFGNIAGIFVRAQPPSDPRLTLYGAGFPAFLETFEPVKHLGYLPDVARLELALRASYNAADAPILDSGVFAQISPELLADVRIDIAPAVRIVPSDWPIVDIWHFNMTPGAPKPRNVAQNALITRPDFDPILHVLPDGAGQLINALRSGTPLGAALEDVHSAVPEFDFAPTLSLLLQSAALSALHQPNQT